MSGSASTDLKFRTHPHSLLHGRDDPGVAPLFNRRVLMIGTGSLGSEVAQLLAMTGGG